MYQKRQPSIKHLIIPQARTARYLQPTGGNWDSCRTGNLVRPMYPQKQLTQEASDTSDLCYQDSDPTTRKAKTAEARRELVEVT